jgi:4-hydroxy-tetrahydrodipicolinate synthase
MLYNVPGRTAVALSTEAVKRLNTHKNFWAIKEASGSVDKFKEYLAAAGGKGVFCGDDALMPEFSNAGSAGLVSVASNAWPKATHLYVEQCLNKTIKEKDMWARASNSLFVCSNPVPVKRLLSHEDMLSSSPVLEANKEVESWFKREM